MKIWFETHATSVDNEARVASGWYDAELSALGVQQARELGARRRAADVVAVYCSDLRRSYATAALAFEGATTPIIRDPRLRECNYGTLTRAPVEQIDALRLDSISKPFPGGESYQDATRRVASWLREASATHGEATVLVVGHRATHFALEHLCKHAPIAEVIARPWRWQPGWEYEG